MERRRCRFRGFLVFAVAMGLAATFGGCKGGGGSQQAAPTAPNATPAVESPAPPTQTPAATSAPGSSSKASSPGSSGVASSGDLAATASARAADRSSTETLEEETAAADIPSTAPRLILSGRVTLKKDGSPVAGATVELIALEARGESEITETPVGEARTDGSGRYRLLVQDRPIFRVSVSREGSARITDVLQDMEAARSGGKQTGVRRMTKNFVLSAASVLAGRVVDEQDHPLQGIKVVAYKGISPDQANATFYLPSSDTTSDSKGGFRFADVEAGSVGLSIDSADYVPLKEVVTAPADDIVLRLESGGGSIGGHVYLKTTGQGVAGATAVLSEQNPSLRFINSGSWRKSITDETGAFRFDRLGAGDYRIQVAKVPLIQVPDKDPKKSTISLGEKEEKTDLTFFLYGGATVHGRVTLKETGEPMEGVEVKPAWGRDPSKNTAITDANGAYTITGLSGLQIGLTAEKKGFKLVKSSPYMSFVQVTLDPDKTDVAADLEMTRAPIVSGTVKTENGTPVADAEVSVYNTDFNARRKKTPVSSDGTYSVEVDPFSTLRIRAEAPGYPMAVSDSVDVGNSPVTGVDIVLKPGGSLAGTVTLPDGKPAAGASVHASARISFGTMSTGDSVGNASTDGAGHFQMTEIPAMEISLSARRQGLAPSRTLRVTLASGESKSDIALQLRTAHFIAGRVTDADGNPVESANVGAFGAGQDSNSAGQARTDADGRYRIEGLADVSYRMYASGTNWGTAQKQDVKVDQDNVDFVLGAENTVTLTGTVIDATTKQPIKDFTVEFQNSVSPVEKDPAQPGRFTVKHLRGGVAYSLGIKAAGYADYGGGYLVVPKDVKTFEKTFELGAGGTIVGLVVDKDSGEPLAGVGVFLRGVGSSWEFRNRAPAATVTTGDDGTFQFQKVSAGTNTIEFHPKPPLIERSLTADVDNNKTTDMGDIRIGAGATIRGHVVRSPGDVGASGIKVHLSGYGTTSLSKDATSDETGAFNFKGLPKGTYMLSVAGGNLQAREDVGLDDTRDVILRIGGCSLSGRVLKGGKPVQASLMLSRDSYSVRINGSSDESGHYEFKSLDPGSYLIDAYNRSGNNDHLFASVVLTAGQALEKDLIFPEGGIPGRVIDANGDPVDAAVIQVRSAGGLINEGARSGKDGTFRVEGLRPDTYTVTATKKDVGSATRDSVVVPETGDAPAIEFQLDSSTGGTVISVVLDMDGKPVQAAWCYLTPPGGHRLSFGIRRDAEGVMKLVGVPPGTYLMQVSYWGYSLVNRTIEVKAGESQTFEDVLYKAGALRWTLTDKDGNILTGVPCRVVPNDPTSIENPRNGETDSTGCLVVRGLYPGDYTGTATLPDGRTSTETYTIRAGELTNKTTRIE